MHNRSPEAVADHPPRVLMVHTRYLRRGGEDRVFESELDLLRARGVSVSTVELSNRRLLSMGALALAVTTVWNRHAYRLVAGAAARHRADIVHIHNTFPLASPSVHHAAHRAGAAVVQTLHNFRLFCLDATFQRSGRICETCLGRAVAWPGIGYRCYRDSVAASGALAAMQAAHRALGTWTRKVDLFIALTEFAAGVFRRGGLPPEKIIVKPNFLSFDPGAGGHAGGYALVVGRLSPEKGPMVAVDAWRSVGSRLPLRVIGEGPQDEEVAALAAIVPGVELVGRMAREQVIDLMKGARLLIVPSICYEGLPLVAAEAFATGLPVVASDLGSLTELVRSAGAGVLFRAGDSQHLAQQVNTLLDEPDRLERFGRSARRAFEESFSADVGFERLMDAYQQALEHRRAHVDGRF